MRACTHPPADGKRHGACIVRTGREGKLCMLVLLSTDITGQARWAWRGVQGQGPGQDTQPSRAGSGTGALRAWAHELTRMSGMALGCAASRWGEGMRRDGGPGTVHRQGGGGGKGREGFQTATCPPSGAAVPFLLLCQVRMCPPPPALLPQKPSGREVVATGAAPVSGGVSRAGQQALMCMHAACG